MTNNVRATGVWKSFLLSLILPIIGGAIVYYRNKSKNKELADICWMLSVLHPIIVGFFGFYLIIALFLSYIFIAHAFEKNKYKYFIPTWYFGLLGGFYSYYVGYKNNKLLQEEIGNFILAQIVAVIAIVILFALYNPLLTFILLRTLA